MSEAALHRSTSLAGVNLSPPAALIPIPQPPAPFAFEGSRFRWVLRDGEPWFVATDLAGFLGYRDAGNMLRNLEEDERGTHNLSTALNELRVGVVSEPGLYHAINARRQVKKLPAEVQERIIRFQRWVNHEVLPSIRRTGTYSVPALPAAPPVTQGAALLDLMRNPAVALELIGHYAAANLTLQEKVEAAAPAVAFQEALVATGETFGLQQAGKALGQAPNGFIAWLLERGDIYRRAGSLCARQHLINRGVMTVKWEPYGGSPRPTTHVTGKGIALYAKILGVKPPEPPRQGEFPGI